MPRSIPLIKSINFRLGFAAIALMVVSASLVAGNLFSFAYLKRQIAWMNVEHVVGSIYHRILYLSARLDLEKSDEIRRVSRSRLENAVNELERRYRQLEKGDSEAGIEPPTKLQPPARNVSRSQRFPASASHATDFAVLARSTRPWPRWRLRTASCIGVGTP